jgi:hypothetical protein
MQSNDASPTVQVGGCPGREASRPPADDGTDLRIRTDLRHSADAMLSSFNDVLLRLQAVEPGSDLTDSVARIARRFEDVHRDIIGLVSQLEAISVPDGPDGDHAN